MPINTHGSGIRVTTNVAGEQLENDSYVASKAAYEHNPQPSSNPWSTNYRSHAEEYPAHPQGTPIPEDEAITKAINNNLKRLGIHHQ